MKGHIWYWFVLGPLFIGGIWVWLWAQGEATGTVRPTLPVVEEAPVEPEPYTYQSQYLTFVVPGIFQEATHTLPESGPVKETIFLVKDGGGNNEKIAVSVEEREEKTFEASPSYQMRKANTLYSEEREKGAQEAFFTKQADPFELTYFFFVDELLVSLSYTATTGSDEQKSMFTSLKESIQKTTLTQPEKSQKSLQ